MAKNNNPGRILKGTQTQPSLKGASGVWTLDEALQYHRANKWPQPNLFQPVPQSLRIKNNSVAGSALYQYKGRGGNQRTWTFSAWVKRSAFISQYNNDQEIFEGWSGTSYYSCHIIWSSSAPTDALQVYDWGSAGGGAFSIQTGAVFRDTTAWYHIVVAVDTTQATNTNRIKIYVNGVQLNPSTFTNPNNWNSGQSGFPSQGYNTLINSSTGLHAIGTSYLPGDASGKRNDGYMSEVNFVDGYQLDAGMFGKFDTTGAWVPVPYTGSYGSNGFYLPFTNAQTSQTLGYDASLNGTPIYNADQDPYRSSVVLHLTGNGPAGQQNNTFADSSTNNVAITRNGTATQGSFSPYPFNTNTSYNPSINGGSAYFNGSSDWLATPQSSNFTFDANFTVEFWVYISTNQNADLVATANNTAYLGAGNSGWVIAYYTSGGIRFGYQASSVWSPDNTLGMTPALNSWNHIAVVRSGSTITGYLNGAAGTTPITNSGTFTSNQYGVYVGAGAGNQGQKLGGYISGLRIIKGAAVYTSNFTPTNRPFGTLTNNLITFSEDFANSNWGKDGGISVTPNYAVAPDGTPSMTLMSRAAGTLGNWAALTWANFVGTGNNAGKTYTFSVWVQATSGTVNGSIAISDVSYNTSTLAFTATTTAQRVSLTYSGPSGVWNASSAYIGGGVNLASVGTSVLVWGAQLEVAGSVTNYTPTPANYATAPTLLLNFANAAIIDSAGANDIVTIGSATVTSSSKYGSGALTFNGTTDRLEISGPSAQSSGSAGLYGLTPSLIPGTKDFTVEYWLNTRTGNDTYHRIVSSSNGAFSGGTFCMRHQPGSFLFSGQLSYSTDFTLNTWTHVAYTRQGATGRGFINGRQVGICTDSTNYTEAIQYVGSFYSAGAGEYFSGQLDDVRITMGVARYQSDFTPPARALPEIGGKSFATVNVNAGVVKRFTLDNLNVVGAKIYHVTTAPRSANYSVQYSDDNSNWTTAFGGVMSSMDGTVGIKIGTVTSGGSGTTGNGSWGPHLYWRYVEGATISGHHPRSSRIIFTDSLGRDFNFKVFAADNSSDIGEYIIGTQSGYAQGPTLTTSWTAPSDVSQIEVLVVAGGGGGGGGYGGGGGGGGVVYNNQYSVTPGQAYTVTVGAGGAAVGGGTNAGNSGSNSVFGSLTAIGGGGGGSGGSVGKTGGSGGGSSYVTYSGGTATAGQGFSGGYDPFADNSTNGNGAGGGGGAGAIGTNAAGNSTDLGGNGGVGLQFGISGAATYYAGGGGGGTGGYTVSHSGAPSTGGLGGGAAGGVYNAGFGASATANTGGGGGGGGGGANGGGASGAGGSGIVLIRYTTSTVGNTSDTTTDIVTDSPTLYGHDAGTGGEVVGNYATWNPLTANSYSPTDSVPVLSNGNLTVKGNTNTVNANSTIAFTSGKYYWEILIVQKAGGMVIGVTQPSTYTGIAAWRADRSGTLAGSASSAYGVGSITSGALDTTFFTGDLIGIAFDVTNSLMQFFKNGVSVFSATWSPVAGTYYVPFIQILGSSDLVTANFGQRPWAYTPPAGYSALTTKNFSRLTIGSAAANPNQYFGINTWTQGATDVTLVNDGGFQPDLVWIKSRSNAQNNYLMDSVRGTTSLLRSNGATVESTGSTWITFNSNGFTPSSANTVTNTYTYIAWQWKAGGTPVSNTTGTITSSVSANNTSGFSIVTWSGNNTNGATIGHGLTSAPSMFIIKARNAATSWYVWHTGLTGATYGVSLDSTAAQAVFTFGTATVAANTITAVSGASGLANINATAVNYVGYFWTEVPGFSKFGSYTGNGSADGAFIYCGFRPRFIMTKRTDSTGDWLIVDTARDTYNPTSKYLQANTTVADGTAVIYDIVSNGFKLRLTTDPNITSSSIIFMAFAEAPFGNTNGTAR
jgi:hypothetical protein